MNRLSSSPKLASSWSRADLTASVSSAKMRGAGPCTGPGPSNMFTAKLQVASTTTVISSTRRSGLDATVAAGAGRTCSCSSNCPSGLTAMAHLGARIRGYYDCFQFVVIYRYLKQAPFWIRTDSAVSLSRKALAADSPFAVDKISMR
jgi:hypothetical protein